IRDLIVTGVQTCALPISFWQPSVATQLAAKKPAAAPAPTEADWRTPDPQDVLVVDTNKGRIIFELNSTGAPQAVARVRELTRKRSEERRVGKEGRCRR